MRRYAGSQKRKETDQEPDEAVKAEAALIAGNWNMVAKNGGISGYAIRKQANLRFRRAQNGLVIDQDKLVTYGGGRSQ